MKTKSDFIEFFNQKLKPALVKLQEQRESLNKKNMTYFYLVLFICITLVAYILFKPNIDENIDKIVIAAFIAFVSFIIFKNRTLSKFKDPQKELINNIIHFVDDSLEYFPKEKISKEFYEKSMLSPRVYNMYSGDDLVRGEKNGVKFSFCELYTKYKDSEKNTLPEDVFHGIFFTAQFNKNIDGYIKITPNNRFDLIEALPNWIVDNAKKVDMDYPEFEGLFDVYSNSQIDSRYILSHSFMQRLIDLYEVFKKPMYISVIKNELFIAIDYRKNLFELKSNRGLDDVEVATEHFNIINSFVGIVEVLKLDEKLYS